MTPCRLAIFDFDGTLADTFPWFVGVFNGVADRYGFRRVETQEVEGLRGMSAREIVAQLDVPVWKLPLIARRMGALAARDIASLSLFEGIAPMLQHLADAGIILAIVTSNTDQNVRRVLGPELGALVRHFACGASMFGKPAKLRRVLKVTGIPPRDSLCIGDEIRDYEAAKAVGLRFGAATWGYTRADALQALKPDLVFECPQAIADALAAPEAVRSVNAGET